MLRFVLHSSKLGKNLSLVTTEGHEEGCFIVRNEAGTLDLVRWPKGEQGCILLPPHPNCKVGDNDIIATFHTHPNIGGYYLQEPSETDKRAVLDDPNMKGEFYEDEFVISQEIIYLITPNGQVSEVGNIGEILANT